MEGRLADRRGAFGSWIRTAPCCSRCPPRRRRGDSSAPVVECSHQPCRVSAQPRRRGRRVHLGMPRPEFLPLGPEWLRGWMAYFFGVVIVLSLLLKFLWRLH